MDTVLVTGTTSGIGKAFAEKFASMGDNIVLVSRNREKLQQQQIDLQSRYQVSVEYISCDLTEVNAADMIMEKISSSGLSVDILINNAGFNEAGCFANTSLSKELDMIQVHIKALTALTKSFLPGMIERGYGRILNIGSTGSYMPCPNDVVYAATKAYVLSFSRALREELKSSGIYVTAVCPGPVDTPFFDIAAANGSTLAIKKYTMVTADRVVALALKSSWRRRSISVCGFPMNAFLLLTKALPHSVILQAMAWMKRKGL